MAATSPERFQIMLASISPFMKQAGFRKRRQLYTLLQHDNVAAIEFQRSSSSTKLSTRFTINLGIWSSRIATAEGRPRDPKAVGLLDCQFRERIGFLLDPKQDTWWDITPETDIDALSSEMLNILGRLAVPEVVALLPDEALRDHLLQGQHLGTTELMRLTYLAILVRDLGPQDRLAEIEAELHDPATKRRQEAQVQKHVDLVQGLGFSASRPGDPPV